MKTTQFSHTRLTDALERELLREAIENQNDFPAIGELVGKLYQKIAAFFRGPEVTIHQTHTAH
ncbi:MAG TPA: hypothetical protein VL024_02485 [Castellaniella sp.]|nr:hypothetical protein [Castellaniella sp.]